MKTQDLIKLLKKNKCYIARHGKKHDLWYSEITGKTFSVPRHKNEIATGTLKSILKDADIEQRKE